MKEQCEKAMEAHLALAVIVRESLTDQILDAAQMIIHALKQGHKLVLCGNGGSAADAQHIAAEFVGRFIRERHSLPALALTTDSSALTAIGNDYGFDKIFSRQMEGLGAKGDILIAISTSGNSPNVLEAIAVARKLGCPTIGLTGRSGGKLAKMVDLCLAIPSDETPRIQEMHILIAHILCDLADQALSD